GAIRCRRLNWRPQLVSRYRWHADSRVKVLRSWALILVLACGCGSSAPGQQAAVSSPQPAATMLAEDGLLAPGEDPENRLGSPFLKHLVGDQERFWKSFTGIAEKKNWFQVAPFLGTTGVLIAADSWISRQVSTDPSSISRGKNISDYGAYSLVAAGGGA